MGVGWLTLRRVRISVGPPSHQMRIIVNPVPTVFSYGSISLGIAGLAIAVN